MSLWMLQLQSWHLKVEMYFSDSPLSLECWEDS